MTRADGKLLLAEESAQRCASDACPGPIREECRVWTAELEAAIPRLSLAVRDQGGATIPRVQIEVDGTLVASEKRTLRLDPGRHRVNISAERFQDWVRDVEVSQGETLSLVAPLLPIPEARNPRRSAAWVFLGVGAASGVAAVILGVNARRLEGNLEECAPDCSAGAVSRAQTQYILTNVAWGLGVASGATGLALWWTSRESTQHSALGVGVSPVGASLSWQGAF